MEYRIEIIRKDNLPSYEELSLPKELESIGCVVESARIARVVYIDCGLSEQEIELFARDVLADPVSEDFFVLDKRESHFAQEGSIDITFLPGVMDSQAMTIARALREIFKIEPEFVATGKRFFLRGLERPQLAKAAEELLFNPLIERAWYESCADVFSMNIPTYEFRKIEVPLSGLGEEGLLKVSREMMLSLSIDEMKSIKTYFEKLGRNPTDVELETIAQTWSEHCVHKTFKAKIQYIEEDENGNVIKEEEIESLFKSYIMKSTKEIDKKWCLSVFKDNAGVMEFDEGNGVCFKVETHNHPSALEPFGGANTGLGGVIRDVLGCGLGARPIANTDVFCFAPPGLEDVPGNVIAPRRIIKGVVSGVRDYGNKMGIPTVNGAVVFDNEFVANPLVFCGTAGIMPKSAVEKHVLPGDIIVVVGGRTGRDGIHGATFSSADLEHETHSTCASAVQIGNPIEEKKVMDVLMDIRDKGWYRAITDCGAGGLSSAVGEMGADTGAVVELEKVPLKYSGLSYAEIWISESQERMVLAVKPEYLDEVIIAFEKQDVKASAIGRFTNDKKLRLLFNGNRVMEIDMNFLHNGVPLPSRKAVWRRSVKEEPGIKLDGHDIFEKAVLDLLSSYNITSKRWVIRQYDHEVQGASVLKPLQGRTMEGPSDSAVMCPVEGSEKGMAISCGINPRYGKIDPYIMAGLCINEAIRQLVSVGADPDKIALLDNFCWGNPERPDRLGGLVRAAKGCYDFALAYKTPFISGKDSLYNEYVISPGQNPMPIPGTLLISSIGIIDNIRKTVGSALQKEGSYIYHVGLATGELGGSEFLNLYNLLGADLPRPIPDLDVKIFTALYQAISQGMVLSSHDISDGGLVICGAEMCIGSGIGMELSMSDVPFEGSEKTMEALLFSESPGRFLIEVSPENSSAFERLFEGLPVELIGKTHKGNFKILDLEGDICVNLPIEKITNAFTSGLDLH